MRNPVVWVRVGVGVGGRGGNPSECNMTDITPIFAEEKRVRNPAGWERVGVEWGGGESERVLT